MKTMAPQYSDRLVAHAQGWARKAGRTYMYRTGQFRKVEWAPNLIRDQGISEGLVGILCTQETCPSFALVPGPKRPQFVDPKQSRLQRRASAAVGRLPKRLHVRQLVAKVPRTRRWRVTERGRNLLGSAVQLYRSSWPQLAA